MNCAAVGYASLLLDCQRRLGFLKAGQFSKFTTILLALPPPRPFDIMLARLRAMRGRVRLAWWHVRFVLAGVRGWLQRRQEKVVLGLPPATREPFSMPPKRALVSYLAAPATWPTDSKKFDGHSNAWESAQLVRILRDSGFQLDVINWDDHSFVGRGHYDVVVDIHGNLSRVAGQASCRVLHVTGSHPEFSNRAERERLAALETRRGVCLRRRRSVSVEAVTQFNDSLRISDLVTLIGNTTTLSTFPTEIRSKIRLVTVSGSNLSRVRSPAQLASVGEFLWFAGSGAVHKGLDLVLEVFARNPQLTLHCVGPFTRELDFVRAYRRELFDLPNIVSHGFINPDTPKFYDIASRCCGFVTPSCSEGISPAVVTCLQFGLVPIISRQCGVDLPLGGGWLLEVCTLDELTGAVHELCDTPVTRLREMIEQTQSTAAHMYSREEFTRRLRSAFAEIDPETIGALRKGATRREHATVVAST